MIRLKLPKRLDIARSCFYLLPDEVETAELTDYELYCRHQYRGVFHSRKGHYYFFQLPSPHDRDLFLAALEYSCKEAGMIVERDEILPL